MTEGAPLIIYSNTLCPVCDAGISWQRRRMIELLRRGGIEFRDINKEPQRLSQFGASLEDIRMKLHALDGGELLVGAVVAVEIWRRSSGQAWLAAIFGNPVIMPLTRACYHILAKLLYRWNKAKGHW
ncbi:thiol-disulfide oxidoreductase DCC family protein [Robiginitomaculum antarcticum]|uniref:thiol-disulfide oxidoreductase DCC family protein n=1 Tax=Robiginitomaculum antarcticum TaxID=437507 RepID=UPI0003680293|nr:DCC1-like thiol-disulfide oxidoreductase family protein [Robiginitomaculum antarcticum]